jgi:glutamate synthase domain-containing protein 2
METLEIAPSNKLLGRFGFINYLTNVREKIKMAQGANPEKVVTMKKVVPWIAETRNSTP